MTDLIRTDIQTFKSGNVLVTYRLEAKARAMTPAEFKGRQAVLHDELLEHPYPDELMKRKILDFFGVTILKTETCSDSLLEEFSRFAQHATEDEAKRWLIRNMDRFTEDEQKEILYTFYEEHKRPASEKADDLSYDEMRNMLDSIAQKKN